MDIGAGQAGAVFLVFFKKRIFKAQKDLKITANAMHDAAGKKKRDWHAVQAAGARTCSS